MISFAGITNALDIMFLVPVNIYESGLSGKSILS